MCTSWTRVFVLLAVILMSAPAYAQAAEAAAVSPQVPWCDSASFSNVDVQRVSLGNDVVIERIKGTPALAHLQEILAKKPKVFQRARKELEERGFQPTDKVYIERSVRLASLSNSVDPTLTGSYTETNADGQVVIWAWDDGDDSTWEGTIYIEVYANGSASTWQGQIDDSTEEHSWVYYTKTYEKPPREPLPVNFNGPRFSDRTPGIINAVFHPDAPQYPNAYMEVGFYEWAKCWRACVVGGCITAAIGCKFSGPGWAPCFGGWCVGAEVGCGVSCALAK